MKCGTDVARRTSWFQNLTQKLFNMQVACCDPNILHVSCSWQLRILSHYSVVPWIWYIAPLLASYAFSVLAVKAHRPFWLQMSGFLPFSRSVIIRESLTSSKSSILLERLIAGGLAANSSALQSIICAEPVVKMGTTLGLSAGKPFGVFADSMSCPRADASSVPGLANHAQYTGAAQNYTGTTSEVPLVHRIRALHWQVFTNTFYGKTAGWEWNSHLKPKKEPNDQNLKVLL